MWTWKQRDTEVSKVSEGSEEILVHALRMTRFHPPAAKADSASSDLTEPSVSRCWKIGIAPGQENGRIGRSRGSGRPCRAGTMKKWGNSRP
jgi:hypothetical protein